MRQIILASQSPRRKELLTAMSVAYTCMPSDIDEPLDNARSPEDVAKELGLGKAMAIAQQNPEAIVIGSDTIVTIDGRQLGKAESLADARQMLRDETLHPNKITTSVVVVCLAEKFQYVDAENAWVYFKPYDETTHEVYLATGDYKDKAGAYGVQSGAASLIESVEGNADVVVGFPTHLLAPVLRKFGYDVQPIEYEFPKEIIITKIN